MRLFYYPQFRIRRLSTQHPVCFDAGYRKSLNLSASPDGHPGGISPVAGTGRCAIRRARFFAQHKREETAA
jgi:hypothetical protein